MTLLYSDSLFLRHDTGSHPERSDRLRAILRRLEASGLAGRCTAGMFGPIDTQAVLAVHDAAMVARAKEVSKQGGGRLDPDTVLSRDSFAVALAATGACTAAVDAVLEGKDRTALCLVRPPGHHATPTRSMGFCLFNSVAVAAHRARSIHGLTRILIVDWDVHHGNGTQDIFYEDPGVLFLSIHRYGSGFYPGTGAADETGQGAGAGFTLNVPLPAGVGRKGYQSGFTRGLEQAATRIRPELVLISAGFDAHRADPIGSLGLESEDFRTMTRQVLDVARTYAGGRLVSCLEGGYDLQALAESVEGHLAELLETPS